MRKKNKRPKITFLLFIAAVAMVLVGLGWYGLRNISPEAVLVRCHHIYSHAIKQELAQFVREQFDETDFVCFDPSCFVETITSRFKIVKEVVWSWDSSGQATVTLEGVKPLFLVNGRFILGNKRILFPNHFFQDLSVGSLRSIEVASLCETSQDVSLALYKILQTIPDSYWDRYTVSCSGDHFVLSDSESRLRLLVDEEALMDRCKMDVVQAWVAAFPLGTKKYVTYDLRFKNCVCASYTAESDMSDR
ncbi:hypothetical protein KKA53_01620 [Candidatus Dependentiae bacterium]|nr:hypothetical protein [Candidatus Dependentiae bacterium]